MEVYSTTMCRIACLTVSSSHRPFVQILRPHQQSLQSLCVDWDDLAMIENLVCAAFTDSQGCTLKDELVSIWSSLIDLILKLSKPSESWYRAGIKHWLST